MDKMSIFPAGYERGRGFFVCAMVSESYGPESNDPRRNNVVVPPDMIPHDDIYDWLRAPGRGLSKVSMLGGPNHSPIGNKPTTLLIQFATETQREAFAKEFGF